jgi:4-amino-4-deoxychorismate lyase
MNRHDLLVESLRCENGALANIGFHNRRLNASRAALLGLTDPWDLADLVRIPPGLGPGLFKCRVVYAERILKIEFLAYCKKTVTRLRIVTGDAIDYSHKYEDRSGLDRLRALAGPDEDVVIVKNGLVTDASASNLVFDTGSELVTPAVPLLRGTRRELLLSRNIIRAAEIRPADLRSFKTVHLVNAMLDLGETALRIGGRTFFE